MVCLSHCLCGALCFALAAEWMPITSEGRDCLKRYIYVSVNIFNRIQLFVIVITESGTPP